MNNSIGGDHIEENNVGAASTGLDLYEIALVSGHGDLLSPSSLQLSGAWRDVLPLDCSGHDVSQQHLGQLVFILQKTCQSFLGHLQQRISMSSEQGQMPITLLHDVKLELSRIL